MYLKPEDTRTKREKRSQERARDYYNDINYDNYRVFCEMNLFYPFVDETYDVTYEDMKTYSEKFQTWKHKHLLRMGVELVELREEFSQEEVTEIACLAVANEVIEEQCTELKIDELTFDDISISVLTKEGTTLDANLSTDVRILRDDATEHKRPRRCRPLKRKRFQELKIEAQLKSLDDQPEKIILKAEDSEVVITQCVRTMKAEMKGHVHSKFCSVPTLVSELCAERDPHYKRLLEIHSCVTKCSCLEIFRPHHPSGRAIDIFVRQHHRRRRIQERWKPQRMSPSTTDFSSYMERGAQFWLRTLSANLHFDLMVHSWITPWNKHLQNVVWWKHTHKVTWQNRWQCVKGKQRMLEPRGRKKGRPPALKR